MTSCALCGHPLGVGRFCLNCGHPVGEPAPAPTAPVDVPRDAPRASESTAGLPYWLSGGRSWVAGGVLLIVLFVVLASCLGGRDDVPADEQSATGATCTGSPRAMSGPPS